MKKKILLAIYTSLILLTSCEYDPNSPIRKGDISISSIFKSREDLDFIRIDVRRPDEYDRGHMPLAINLPLRTIQKEGIDLEGYENVSLEVYGSFTRDSERARDILYSQGAGQVQALEGFKENPSDGASYGVILARDFSKLDEEEIFVIDTREAEDYARGHVRGAVNIENSDFGDKLKQVPRDKEIYIYGYASDDAFAQALTDYRDRVVLVLDGTDYYDYDFTEEDQGSDSEGLGL